MKNINGWVERESFPAKNQSACQEATGTGCNSLSGSECVASKERPRSKIETGFSSFMELFPGNGQVDDPAFGGYVLVPSRNFEQSRHKIVAHSVKQP
jgi:hypothetical protein